MLIYAQRDTVNSVCKLLTTVAILSGAHASSASVAWRFCQSDIVISLISKQTVKRRV